MFFCQKSPDSPHWANDTEVEHCMYQLNCICQNVVMLSTVLAAYLGEHGFEPERRMMLGRLLLLLKLWGYPSGRRQLE